MTSGLLQVAQAAEDPVFRSRVKAAMYQLVNESLTVEVPPDDEAPPGKEAAKAAKSVRERTYVATQIAGAPDMFVSQFAWLCAAVPAVRDTVTDESGTITVAAPDAVILALARRTWLILTNN